VARRAEEGERLWRQTAEEASRDRALAQDATNSSVEGLEGEAQRLRAELDEFLQPRAAGADDLLPPLSFETEHTLLLAAEEQRRVLRARLAALAAAAEGGHAELPPLLEDGDTADEKTFPRLRLNAVAAHRTLHGLRREHRRELQELVADMAQQLRERDVELQTELDGLLGSGLPRLLDALQDEGLVRKKGRPKPDPDRAARLRTALLKF